MKKQIAKIFGPALLCLVLFGIGLVVWGAPPQEYPLVVDFYTSARPVTSGTVTVAAGTTIHINLGDQVGLTTPTLLLLRQAGDRAVLRALIINESTASAANFIMNSSTATDFDANPSTTGSTGVVSQGGDTVYFRATDYMLHVYAMLGNQARINISRVH
jgi:hypothetical protein